MNIGLFTNLGILLLMQQVVVYRSRIMKICKGLDMLIEADGACLNIVDLPVINGNGSGVETVQPVKNLLICFWDGSIVSGKAGL
ncbi:MAG: hypothetical protein D8M54_24455 [Chloroflexi bacterium]|nr:hypothetical protein [Chloroflexota bacterium]